MATRKAFYCAAWRHTEEIQYDSGFDGTPTSSGGTVTCDLGTDRIAKQNNAGDPTTAGMSYTLAGFKTVSVADDGSWSDGTTRRILYVEGFVIFAKKSGSNWVLYTTINDGTTLIQESATSRNFATNYEISVSRQIGSPYRCRIWVNDVLDIDGNGTSTGAGGLAVQIGTNAGSTGGSVAVGPVLYLLTDTDEHIDASTIDVQRLVTLADGNYAEFTGDETGSSGSAPYEDSIDEDAGSADGDTTYIQCPAVTVATYRASFTTTDITLGNVLLIRSGFYQKGTVAAKVIQMYSLTRYNGTDEEIATANLATTTYGWYSCLHYLDPEGNPWGQTAVDGLEIGVRATLPVDLVALRVSTIYCEAGGCDFTANPATSTRRRTGPALGSSNAMVF